MHTFPSKVELATLAAQPRKPLGLDLIDVEEWRLDLRAPNAASPEHSLLAVATPKAKPSAALDCVAREVGRILLATPNKRPSIGVRRFIAGRCGALVALPAFQTWTADASTQVTDQALVAQVRTRLNEPFDASAEAAGVALVRDEHRALVVLAYAKPEVAIQTFDQVVGQDGVLKLRGRVLFDTDSVRAYVNAGQSEVKACKADQSVAPPAFALSCPLAPGDESAWVELSALPRGRVLGHAVLSMLALRQPDSALVYNARRLGEEKPVQDVRSFEASVFELLNAIRGQAGLSPLKSAPAQSQTADSVTPALFSALLSDKEDTEVVDNIALGLLAGWDVRGGTIRGGNLTTSLSVDTHDAGRWLTDALEMPLGRVVLLDPKAHVLALGAALQQQPSVLAAVALTYAFFEDETTPGERAMQLLERLGTVRKARKLGRTLVVRSTPDVDQQLARVHGGQETPGDALRAMMTSMSQATGRPVRGLVWETQDLDAIEFPSELLEHGDLAISAGVTYYRAKGGAWGQYTVLFVVVHLTEQIKV